MKLMGDRIRKDGIIENGVTIVGSGIAGFLKR